MIRKKKKRSVVPVKNPFKELTLPFEGRRMLIRAEDIQYSPSFDTTKKNVSADSREPDLICPISSTRPTYKKVNCCKNSKQYNGEDKSFIPINNQHTDFRPAGVSRNIFSQHSSFVEFSAAGTTRESKADDCFRKMPVLQPRLQKKDNCRMYKVMKDCSGDRADSFIIHTSTSCSDGNIHKHTDAQRHGKKRGQATYHERQSLNDEISSLTSDQDDDGGTGIKSNNINHQQSPSCAERVQHCSSCLINSAGDEDLAESRKHETNKFDICHKTGNDDIRTEEMNSIQHQAQNISIGEGKSTKTYHVRREKHFAGDKNTEYSYVIRVDCQSHDDNNGGDAIKATKAFTKRRRGDIARMRSFLKESSEPVRSPANKIPLSSEPSPNAEVSIEVPHQFIDCRRTDQTRDSCVLSTNEIHQHHPCCKVSSTKNRVPGRLIDHLERKESLQAAGKAEIFTCSDSPDTAGATRRRDESSVRIVRASRRRDRVSSQIGGMSTLDPSPPKIDLASKTFDEISPRFVRASQCETASPKTRETFRRIEVTSPRNNRVSRKFDKTFHKIDGNSWTVMKAQHFKANNQDRGYLVEQSNMCTNGPRTCFTGERPHFTICQHSSRCARKENSVSIDNNVDDNVLNNLIIEQVSEDSFNDLALANLNENKKHTRGFCRSKVTDVHRIESRKNTESQVNHGECNNYKAGVKLRTATDNDPRKDNDFNQRNCRIINQQTSRGDHARNKFTDKSKLINYQFMPKNEEVTSHGQWLDNSQKSVTIKRVLRPGVVHLSECTTNSGQKSPTVNSTSNTDHLDTNDDREDKYFWTRKSEKNSSSMAFKKSPGPTLKYSKSDASPVFERYCNNQSCRPLSSSKISRQGLLTSPHKRNETDHPISPALPKMLESLSLQQSMEMSPAHQNENCSNRTETKHKSDTGSIHSNCVCTCGAQQFQSPRPKTRNIVADESGMSTLNELREILDEARSNNFPSFTHKDLNTSATHLSCAEFLTDGNAGCSFLGQYLRSLWKNQILCDTKVIVGQEEILVHKLVLAAYSSLFCPPTSRPEPTVSFSIPNSSSEAVHEIFSYMYTSTMTLTDDVLEDVINAAIFMGVHEVIDIVKDILIHPTLDNMNLYNGIVRRLGLHISLLDQEKVYRESFSEMKNKVAFLNLSLQELETILMDPEVMVSNEIETIEVIISWVEYNYLQRVSGLMTLLNHVSFECIPPNELAKLSEKYGHIFDTPAGNAFMSEAFKFHALNCAEYLTVITPEDQLNSEFGGNKGDEVRKLRKMLTFREPQYTVPVTKDDYPARYTGEKMPCPCNKEKDQEEKSRIINKGMTDTRRLSQYGIDKSIDRNRFKNLVDTADARRLSQYGIDRSIDRNRIKNWVDTADARRKYSFLRNQSVDRNRVRTWLDGTVTPTRLRTSVKSSIWDLESPDKIGRRGGSRGSLFRGSKTPIEMNSRLSRSASTNTLPNSGQSSIIEIGNPYSPGRKHPSMNITQRQFLSQLEKKIGKGRTSRVSFHETTVDGSPEIPTAMKYVPKKSESNVSRNNNAFDDAMMFLLNRANNLQPQAQKNSKPGSDINASSNNLEQSGCGSVKPKELLTDYSHRIDGHNRDDHLNESLHSSSSRQSCQAFREIKKSTSFENHNPKEVFYLNNPSVICMNETETNESLRQHNSEVLLEKTVLFGNQVHCNCIRNVDDNQQTQREDDQKYLSIDRNTSCKCITSKAKDDQKHLSIDRNKSCMGITCKAKSTCTSVETSLEDNGDRGCDKSKDKKVTEDSLILLGHDAEKSAFRVYKPLPDQLGL